MISGGWFSHRRSRLHSAIYCWIDHKGVLGDTASQFPSARIGADGSGAVSPSASWLSAPQRPVCTPAPAQPGALASVPNDDAPPNGLQAGRGVTQREGV